MRTEAKSSILRRFSGLMLGLCLASGAVAPAAFANGKGHGHGHHGHGGPAPTYNVPGSAQDVRDDRQDLVQLNLAVNQWHAARAQGDYWTEIDADRRIQFWLQEEVVESRHEAVQAQAELAMSRAAVRESARHVARDSHSGVYTGGAAEHQANLAALRDDEMDASYKRQDAERVRVMWDEISAMQPRFDANAAGPGMYQRKSVLYRHLQAAAVAELNGDRGEMYEDGVAMNYSAPPVPPAPGRRR